ncbi:nicotinate-nucleotide adenylyltransferase [Legionella clemsonensis]|uniref:Probable nicotinate-nucleotide adenylyltransferase n=1 Tax=Legionella clemsonensis TaxID=1867846 RepID=A0A222P1X1_9GAMM|nr:nicotinate-nucleotide adenylyltransferase [Legionella clemsonensis]ASQ45765.1 Nicotinate-nucleotide adenylyltransferase [Legionella clemsonensis]
MDNLIIYGGTFDPVHKGHLNIAENIQHHFHFDQFIFLPCKTPVLKDKAMATATQRVEMLTLALKNHNKSFTLDLSEINRGSPSYMVSTLTHFRRRFGENVAITLLMGLDTFRQLPQWYQWEKLLSLANLLIVKRPGLSDINLSEELIQLLLTHEVPHNNAIKTHPYGLIYRYDAGDFNISSTWLRQQLERNEDVSDYIPESVLNYIQKNNLYKSGTDSLR